MKIRRLLSQLNWLALVIFWFSFKVYHESLFFSSESELSSNTGQFKLFKYYLLQEGSPTMEDRNMFLVRFRENKKEQYLKRSGLESGFWQSNALVGATEGWKCGNSIKRSLLPWTETKLDGVTGSRAPIWNWTEPKKWITQKLIKKINCKWSLENLWFMCKTRWRHPVDTCVFVLLSVHFWGVSIHLIVYADDGSCTGAAPPPVSKMIQ